MPTINVSEIIERAKIAADMENSNFVSPSGWLYFANSEYKNIYTRVAKMGWPLKTTVVSVTSTGAYSYSIAEPAAIVSIKRISSTGALYGVSMKSEMSLKNVTPPGGMPREVIVTKGPTDTVILRFNPNPAVGVVFQVSTVPAPLKLVLSTPAITESTTISLPLGWEERIVLGMARRALSKEETVNHSMEHEIVEMDNVIENSAFSFLLAEAGTVVDMDETEDRSWYWF